MHRLLRNLDEAIERARIPRELPFLRAERAVVYARLGELDLARREVQQLRQLGDTHTQTVLGAWLWLAEGLADYFENVSLRARERVGRAVVQAAQMRAPRAHSLAAAWLAHFDFRVHDYAATIEHVRIALTVAPATHHSARSRACTVVAGAYHYAGREDLAQPWYLQARAHATAEGDGSALSSLMYNMAALRVMEVRLNERFGASDGLKVKRARLGTDSSRQLDLNVRTKALSHHTPMQQALVLSALGEHAAALALYDAHLDAALREGLAFSECLFQADRATCLLALGQGDEALTAARQAESAFLSATEPEEQAIAHALLAPLLERLGLPEIGARHLAAAEAPLQLYRSRSAALLEMLEQADLARYRLGPLVADPKAA
ncbi:hypothetical protein [Sphaerotilus mobilis]|uniref:MalT-like TPR region domain-containing protein n=1 Tax=Sphaerotilus mobilis TaxID=47994 RepID=A0A4Q7L9Y0_9BURK|nr:hypothetical protein [Sphaerotilus mobilis]RZS46824.1 hypothetical protein EV685_3855 [Sphaerotilus mobilis]